MSGKRSRNKGARGERVTAEFLREVYPNARRGVGQTQSGDNGADVEGTPWWVEVKFGKQPNIRAAMAQAKDACDHRRCLAITKRDREDMLVTMEIDTFLAIIDGYEKWLRSEE